MNLARHRSNLSRRLVTRRIIAVSRWHHVRSRQGSPELLRADRLPIAQRESRRRGEPDGRY